MNQLADMPPKVYGQHRWVAIVIHTVSAEQVSEVVSNSDGELTLSDASLVAFEVGCVDCEEEYLDAKDTACPAGDTWTEVAS